MALFTRACDKVGCPNGVQTVRRLPAFLAFTCSEACHDFIRKERQNLEEQMEKEKRSKRPSKQSREQLRVFGY